jgi:vitamin B12 transporter
MLRRQRIYESGKWLHQHMAITALLMTFLTPYTNAQKDTARILKSVLISAEKKNNNYNSAVPEQILTHQIIQEINGESIADAAKFFSGVLIKDYGGIGGLKTISVRSLGSLNTSLLYDGVLVADAQTGQIDLSKFSSTFTQSVQLDESNPLDILLPARVYSSAAVLSVNTSSYRTNNFTQDKWRAGIRQGSFGLWQPYAGIYLPTGKKFVVSINAEGLTSKGNYPYNVENGMFSQKLYRANSDIKSLQEEINIVKHFADSSQWQTKFWGYESDRGLPGSIIFFNNISAQRLWDRDFFAQSQYRRRIKLRTSILFSVKFSSLFTRYKDPNFLNNAGGLDDRYSQNEIYGSFVISHQLGKYVEAAFASDFALTHLGANIAAFPTPTRLSWWNSLSMQYARTQWYINGSILNTTVHDMTRLGMAASAKEELTPAIAISYRPFVQGSWLIRSFYKDIFRLPTFNDIYYNYTNSINSKLLPEFSNQSGLGVTYSKGFNSFFKLVNVSLDGYYSWVKDKIISVPSQNLFMWTVLNLGKTHIKGVDLTAESNGIISSTMTWSTRIACTLQQALDVTDPSSAEYKNEIPYTPDFSGSALVSFYYTAWNVGYSLLYSGRRFTLGANNPANEIPGWASQDIFAGRKFLLKRIEVNVKVQISDLFNERYEVVRYFPMPGRSFMVSIIFINL